MVDNLTKALLENNTLVIFLNLVDLLENEQPQCDITDDFRRKMHVSVNGFFRQLKDNPASLHPELSSLADLNLPMYLSGASFGGGMVAEHACMFPDTWSGYSSLNGSLASLNDRFKFDPSQNVGCLKQRFLAAVNFYDNRVPMLKSILFNEAIEKCGNGDLIQTYCNTHPFALNSSEPSLTGHSWSDNQEDFSSYLKMLLLFMAGEKDDEAKKTFQRAELLARANHESATFCLLYTSRCV